MPALSEAIPKQETFSSAVWPGPYASQSCLSGTRDAGIPVNFLRSSCLMKDHKGATVSSQPVVVHVCRPGQCGFPENAIPLVFPSLRKAQVFSGTGGIAEPQEIPSGRLAMLWTQGREPQPTCLTGARLSHLSHALYQVPAWMV